MSTILTLLLCVLPQQSTSPKFVPLTFETIGEVELDPTWSERWFWADDERTLERRRGEERAWFDARTGEPAAEPKREPSAPERSAPELAPPDAKELNERYGVDRAEFPTLAPDGSKLAYVLDNDLFVADVATAKTIARTTEGSESMLFGKLDWVYQEEVYGRGKYQAFWWSPTGARVAFLALDESPVHAFTVVDHVEDGHFRVTPEITHYPKAGDPNPVTRLGVLDVANDSIEWMELGSYDEALVVRVGWTPAGALWYVVQDRLQTLADLCVWNPASAVSSVWIQERSRSWVERPEPPRWLADGSFLWQSERTGYLHVYHYGADGLFQRAVTAGDWAVRSVSKVDEAARRIRFTGTRDGADERHVYSISLEGSELAHLTPGRGAHRLQFNDDESLALDRFSAIENPGVYQLVDARTGAVVRQLGEASAANWDAHELPRWRALEVPTRDGLLLDGALLPPKLKPGATKAPLWIVTYSGPDAPSVTDRWSTSAWFAFLSSQGIAVFQMNVRTASGMGRWAIEQCYKDLGRQELADFEDALDWLAENEPWFDAARVGITGYSYGGFMTAYALTKSKRFTLGIAGGGVYDWGLYDTIYTERYMSTPQRNPAGYASSSVLQAAQDLSGHLVVKHGVMDDNVHVQNAMHLAWELQQAGKDFELMLYPQARHGLRNAQQRQFDRRLDWRAIQEHLLAPTPRPKK